MKYMENQTAIFETVQAHSEPVVIGDLLNEIEAVIKIARRAE